MLSIAMVRTTILERIVRAFEEVGIKSMTISPIKGLDEEVHLHDPYSIHDKIEIILPDDKVEKVVALPLANGRIGAPGDGIIAVQSLDYTVKMRSEEWMA